VVTLAMRHAFFTQDGAAAVGSARAGNVIGGGDWAADRLLPDLERAVQAGERAHIRNPGAVRPWQHVLEPLAGYLVLAEKLCEGGRAYARAWNFGPHRADALPVARVVEQALGLWGAPGAWQAAPDAMKPEAGFLSLDAGQAHVRLGWRPRLRIAEALDWTVSWYRRFRAGEPALGLVQEQIRRYATLHGTAG